jgi:hypothetical protein
MHLVTAGLLCAAAGTTLLAPCPAPSVRDAARGPLHTGAITQWQPVMAAAAQRMAVPLSWVRAVMMAESGGRMTVRGRLITSSAGAMGLMQIMPATYRDLRARYHLGPDPFDPGDNIFAGAAYLRALYERYGYPNLFAAYHGGPGRLDAYFERGTGLPRSTRAYLDRIVPGATTGLPAHGRVAPLVDHAPQRSLLTPHRPSDALFVVYNTPRGTAASTTDTSAVTAESVAPKRASPVSQAPSLFVPLASDKPFKDGTTATNGGEP